MVIVANTVGISQTFAKRILLTSLHGVEEDLFNRKRASDAFDSTEWPKRFQDFTFRPENARSVPGGEISLINQ